MKTMRNLLTVLFVAAVCLASAQTTTFPVNGTVDKHTTYTAFINATVQVDPSTQIQNATLLVKNGRVVAVGTEVELPENTYTYDLEGLHIYPSFIDLHSQYGLPRMERKPWEPYPQYESNTKGAYGWNQAVKPETDAAAIWSVDEKKAKGMLQAGVGVVLTHQQDGIFRGTGAVVMLGSDENTSLIQPGATTHASFSKGTSRQSYPGSLMGSIALLRQTYMDADWYATAEDRSEANLSLDALLEQMELPAFFEVGSAMDALRADKVGDEAGIQYIFKGSGDEYKRLAEIQATEAAFVLPLDFPKAYDVSDPFNARMVSLADMKHWEQAPTNPARLADAGVTFALTMDGLGRKQFYANLRKAMEYGFTREQALAALTTTPAALIQQEAQLGKLEAGYRANFVIASGDIFGEKTVIHEHWVAGERHAFNAWNTLDLSGTYDLSIGDVTYNMKVKGNPGKHKASFEVIGEKEDEDGNMVADTSTVEVKLMQEDRLVTLSFDPDDTHHQGILRLSGNVHSKSRIWDGKGQLPNGTWTDWVAIRAARGEQSNDSMASDSTAAKPWGDLIYPLMAYGRPSIPEQKTLLIEDATIWTCEEEGKIANGQVLIHDGKIVAVGKDLRWAELLPKGTGEPTRMNARGKHVTPGVIDEHSHIALRSVNEGAQASSAEVREGDVIDAEDINIYRQLAGGVTAAQLLHGSANPIGGQSALIKMRWGMTPEEMKIEDAPGFIKFALGENVKQANWGDFQTVRFPQTRMGVEQVYYDHFIRAREYNHEWSKYELAVAKLSRRDIRNGNLPLPPRRDLELECLYEILDSERFVSCHSYQQGEINMLMHVADSMGFTLNTFTHILEGYKVADKMAAHGAGGSSFSDWWAYKYEVKDAIPYNGALMWEQGVVTAFNSDDREMARRLNQEAGKAVKYGGVPEEEALKFVTLNPAILLHLDDRMGSLAPGKDADLVIWSDHPLSIYAQAEHTFVDGRMYYSQEDDAILRTYIQAERARLTQLMLGAKQRGEPTQIPVYKTDRHFHCDTMDR